MGFQFAGQFLLLLHVDQTVVLSSETKKIKILSRSTPPEYYGIVVFVGYGDCAPQTLDSPGLLEENSSCSKTAHILTP